MNPRVPANWRTTIQSPVCPPASVPVIYLPGPAIQRGSPLEFGHTDILIEGGYQAARSFLDDLDITGPDCTANPGVAEGRDAPSWHMHYTPARLRARRKGSS